MRLDQINIPRDDNSNSELDKAVQKICEGLCLMKLEEMNRNIEKYCDKVVKDTKCIKCAHLKSICRSEIMDEFNIVCEIHGDCYNYEPMDDCDIPSHYSIRGFDPYFVTKLWSEFDPDMTHQEAIFRSNALKYLWRYRHKSGLSDLDKCIDELNKLRDEYLKQEV